MQNIWFLMKTSTHNLALIMINLGKFETKTLNDGWTAVTKDKSLSAQFEHTIGVTEEGCEIFTLSKNK